MLVTSGIRLPQVDVPARFVLRIVAVPGHHVATGVVVPMPAPPEEPPLVDQMLHIIRHTGVCKPVRQILTRLGGRRREVRQAFPPDWTAMSTSYNLADLPSTTRDRLQTALSETFDA